MVAQKKLVDILKQLKKVSLLIVVIIQKEMAMALKEKLMVELAQEWRTDRAMRKLEAMLLCADRDNLMLISGTGEVIEPDAVAARIGEGRVAAAGAGEFGVELNDVADVEYHQKGRPAFVGGLTSALLLELAKVGLGKVAA